MIEIETRLPILHILIIRQIVLPLFDDGILIKNNHRVILMIEKIEKYIIYSSEDKALNIDQYTGELFRNRYFVP